MKSLILLGIPIALAACTATPDLASDSRLAPAADPQSEIRHVHGPNLLSDYTERPVQEPGDWRKLNEEQSPATQEDD